MLLGILYGQRLANSFVITLTTRVISRMQQRSLPHVVAWNDVMCEKFVYLCLNSVLTLPQGNYCFILPTDASGRGISAILVYRGMARRRR